MTAVAPPPPPRGFPPAEFAARLERAQRLMSAAELDCLLLTTEPDVRYFSGFQTAFWRSPTRPWFLLVPKSGKPVAVIPSIGAPLMSRTWLDDIRVWESPRPRDEGVSLLAETLREVGGRRIGLPMGAETCLRMPLADYDRLRALAPGAGFVSDGEIMRRLRMRKSAAEIAKIAHVCGVAAAAFAAAPEFVAVGRTMRDIFRAFQRELLAGGADDAPYLAGAAGAGGYGDVISPPTDEPLRAGDVLMMDAGATYDGYFCDFDRNFAVGRADAAVLRLHGVLCRATVAGHRAAIPGATCAQIFAAMAREIEDAGCAVGNVGRFGHGLGMRLTEWPSIAADDQTVLTPGMVLTLEPFAGFSPACGMAHEEDIVIREEGGAEWLSRGEDDDWRLPVVGES